MGRPVKDAFTHELQGTIQRSNMGESHVAGSLPKPPKFLSKEARKWFKNMTRLLSERRAVTAGDGDLIAIYCSTKERWLQALEVIREQGVVVEYERLGADGLAHKVEKPNNSLKIAEVAERAMVSMLTRLGMTPKDREGVRPTSPAKARGPQPPAPDSAAGLALEAARLRKAMADEQTQAADAEPEPDLDAIPLGDDL